MNLEGDILKEQNELILHIYKDAEMSCYTLKKLLTDLKDKDNKIKKTVEDVLKDYEDWKVKTKKHLKKEHAEIKENGMFAKMMAGMGIKKEVKDDNSDSAIADMLIKGISMGSIDMEKKIKQYQNDIDEKDLNFAKKFLEFQEKAINIFKEYL